MIIPLNKHVLVKPVVYEGFIASQKETYEEKGVVLAVADGVEIVKEGDTILFDSWLACKYPAVIEGEFDWLVPSENIRAKHG